MSKAFTKDDGEGEGDAPLGASRAPLPAGSPNYVTARGLRLLRDELADLDRRRSTALARAAAGEPDARAEATKLAAKIAELEARLGVTELVDPTAQPHDEVRFGATVTLEGGDGAVSRYRIVGVDEADVAAGMLAFTSPLARALRGKRVGDVATRGGRELEITRIEYDYVEPSDG